MNKSDYHEIAKIADKKLEQEWTEEGWEGTRPRITPAIVRLVIETSKEVKPSLWQHILKVIKTRPIT